jgi:hypothetical protein
MTEQTEQQAHFEGWAKVEVMGHQSHIGFVKTEAYGAAVLFRIDTPPLPEREFTLDRPKYMGTGYYPTGAVVKMPNQPGSSVLVGAGSIYRIIPCTEEAAMAAIDSGRRGELMLVSLPPEQALPQPNVRCEDCGQPEEFCTCTEEDEDREMNAL